MKYELMLKLASKLLHKIVLQEKQVMHGVLGNMKIPLS